MALRLKKDIKKSSYYVWFLGAQESRGLRGDEYALPAIEHLERRSRDLEPFKVTLQVSHKGLKIIQNVAPKGKQQTIKHFIPHGSITSVAVRGDVVAAVLLLFNPLTGCPLHVHAYRCDSDRTAEMLCAHLQALIDKPENQKKFADIERKLQIKGALPSKKPPDSSLGSELSTRESESGSSEERCVANLYDSLAAELKQKLSTGKSPILLPPRDYDTVHRQKGNLSGIDTRRCLNQNIVGVNARRKMESSGGSSGIGSDLAPSPDQEYPRQHDNQSTSEEDWAESTAYLMHEAYDVSPTQRALSPPRRAVSPVRRGVSPPRRAVSPVRRGVSPPRRGVSPVRRAVSPPRRAVSPVRRGISPPRRAVSPVRRAKSPRREPPFEPPAPFRDEPAPYREKQPYRDEATAYRDQTTTYRDQTVNYRDRTSYDRRYRPESLDRIETYADKLDKYVEKVEQIDRYAEKAEKADNFDKYDEGPNYRRRFAPEQMKQQLNRSVERLDDRPRVEDRRLDSRDDRRHYAPKLQRGTSEGSLKIADTSPKDRFNVAKEKFMNLERERFNKELEKHMKMRRNMIERNGRATSSPEEDDNPRLENRERSRRDDIERSRREVNRPRHTEEPRRTEVERPRDMERPRRDEIDRPRHDELPIERQLPRVGRKVLPRDAEPRRFEFGSEDYFDRQEKSRRDEFERRERRELDRRIEEDIVEPMDERRRDWTDRQRNFSRSRLVEEQRQSYVDPQYYQRDYRDLADREPTKFRHSYAEPIPRGRLGMAALRPY